VRLISSLVEQLMLQSITDTKSLLFFPLSVENVVDFVTIKKYHTVIQ
jgi:hypothetical protein